MPFRAPRSAGEPITALDADVLRKAVKGLLDADPERQELAVRHYLHPDAQYADHFSKADGRWSAWKVLRANTGLFDINLVPQNIVVDRETLQGVAWVDQRLRPRVPLHSLLPALPCPTIVHTRWSRQPEGNLLIVDISFTTQIYMLGPLGPWVQYNLVQPYGRFTLEVVTELLSFGISCKNYVKRLLSQQQGAHAHGQNGPDLAPGMYIPPAHGRRAL